MSKEVCSVTKLEYLHHSIGKQIFKMSYTDKLKAKGSYGSQANSIKNLKSQSNCESKYEIYDDLKKAVNNVYSA